MLVAPAQFSPEISPCQNWLGSKKMSPKLLPDKILHVARRLHCTSHVRPPRYYRFRAVRRNFVGFLNNRPAGFLYEHYGFSEEFIPEIVPTFGHQGRVSAEIAAELGLSEEFRSLTVPAINPITHSHSTCSIRAKWQLRQELREWCGE